MELNEDGDPEQRQRGGQRRKDRLQRASRRTPSKFHAPAVGPMCVRTDGACRGASSAATSVIVGRCAGSLRSVAWTSGVRPACARVSDTPSSSGAGVVRWWTITTPPPPSKSRRPDTAWKTMQPSEVRVSVERSSVRIGPSRSSITMNAVPSGAHVLDAHDARMLAEADGARLVEEASVQIRTIRVRAAQKLHGDAASLLHRGGVRAGSGRRAWAPARRAGADAQSAVQKSQSLACDAELATLARPDTLLTPMPSVRHA